MAFNILFERVQNVIYGQDMHLENTDMAHSLKFILLENRNTVNNVKLSTGFIGRYKMVLLGDMGLK